MTTKSSGNVFADIGLPDADVHLVKAGVVAQLLLAIKAKKLSRASAAKRLGLAVSALDDLLRGHFQDVPIDTLVRYALALGNDVVINIGPAGKASAHPSLRVVAAE